MNLKLVNYLQQGKPLNERQSALLDANPKIASYYTEPDEDGKQMVCIELAAGFNYEGRESFIAYGWREAVQQIKHIAEDIAE
jgi:hypothetical protein